MLPIDIHFSNIAGTFYDCVIGSIATNTCKHRKNAELEIVCVVLSIIYTRPRLKLRIAHSFILSSDTLPLSLPLASQYHNITCNKHTHNCIREHSIHTAEIIRIAADRSLSAKFKFEETQERLSHSSFVLQPNHTCSLLIQNPLVALQIYLLNFCVCCY